MTNTQQSTDPWAPIDKPANSVENIKYVEPNLSPYDKLPFILKWLCKIGVFFLCIISMVNGVLGMIAVSISCIFAGIIEM